MEGKRKKKGREEIEKGKVINLLSFAAITM